MLHYVGVKFQVDTSLLAQSGENGREVKAKERRMRYM